VSFLVNALSSQGGASKDPSIESTFGAAKAALVSSEDEAGQEIRIEPVQESAEFTHEIERSVSQSSFGTLASFKQGETRIKITSSTVKHILTPDQIQPSADPKRTGHQEEFKNKGYSVKEGKTVFAKQLAESLQRDPEPNLPEKYYESKSKPNEIPRTSNPYYDPKRQTALQVVTKVPPQEDLSKGREGYLVTAFPKSGLTKDLTKTRTKEAQTLLADIYKKSVANVAAEKEMMIAPEGMTNQPQLGNEADQNIMNSQHREVNNPKPAIEHQLQH